MSNGIAHNNLNDISKIYLDTISDINKKGQEDDVNRWTQKEETGCETKSPFKKKKVKEDWQPEIEHSKLGDAKKKADKKRESKLPPHLRGDAIGKMKKAFANEGYSDWRTSLREVTSDAEAAEVDAQPEIKEKKVKNKIKINPSFLEAVKDMGGKLLEVTEVDSPDSADKAVSDKEKKLKLRILRLKMRATRSGADNSIIAGYEPDIEGAIEYFYEEGINEEGIDQLIEEIGLDEFVNFIEGGTVELNEERAARKASVRAKSYAKVKAEVDASDAAKKKSKKAEYSAAYKKKETDVTVYDDKPSAKKKAPAGMKKAVARKKEVLKQPVKKKPVTKKVVKAVAKVKKTQPAKKSSKKGLGDKIRSAYKKGVERHKAATKKASGEVKKIAKTASATAKQHSGHRKKFVSGLKATKKEKKIAGGIGKAVKKAVTGESTFKRLSHMISEDRDQAFKNVVARLQAKHGKDSVVTKDNPMKPPTDAQKKKAAAERKKRDADKAKAFAGRAKKAGYKSTQDYANVVARYGSEDNMKKGKGLGT